MMALGIDWGKRVFAARLNKNKTLFVGKQHDVTEDFLRCIVKMAGDSSVFDMEVDGIKFTIRVVEH